MIIDKNIVSNEIGKIIHNARPWNFRFQQVSEVEVLKAVKTIKTNAKGIDDISAFFIKTGIEIALPFITDIINNALKLNYFPKRWKLVLIWPIPKTPNPVSPAEFSSDPYLCYLLSQKSIKNYHQIKWKIISLKKSF